MAHAFRIEPTPTPRSTVVRPRLRAVPHAVPVCRPRPSRAERRPSPHRRDHTVVAGIRVRRGARYTARRVAAVVVLVAVLAAAWLAVAAVGRTVGLPAAAGADPVAAPDGATVTAVETVSVVVEPGDTVWALAARVAGPTADPRPVVDAIVDHLGTAALIAGDRIELPADLVA